jgi:phosphatidylglycerol:prolipoprotein diacylglycerol transferase
MVLVSVGDLTIYWYGALYVIAFWIAYFLLPALARMQNVALSRDVLLRIIAYGAAGVLLGGRIGYAVFYEGAYFLAHPGEMLAIWHGGMSSHGGFLGAALGIWIASRTVKNSRRIIADLITVPVAIGLGLGRIGNLINGEFGSYPIYEAGGDFLIALTCYLLLRARKPVFPLFLMLYSLMRFFLEFIRPQEWGYLLGMSRGQVLTIPLFLVGIFLWLNTNKK